MKKDLIEALQWERDHGFRTPEECARLIEEESTPTTVMVLQESQEPRSYAKDGPPRFVDPIPLFSAGVDLSQYLHFKGQSPARRQPAVTATDGTKTLSEVDLIEARIHLYNAAAGGPVAKLPADIHARLFHAIVG